MEKRPWGVALSFLVWPFVTLTVYVFFLSDVPPARRRLATERSERTVEEAEKNRMLRGALTQ